MKKVIILSVLLLAVLAQSYGQWYVKKYNVQDINLLSRAQLDESLGASKKSLLGSGLIAGIGAAGFFIIKYSDPPLSDDPTFWEQLIGSKGMNDIGMALCAGMFAGGTIASAVFLGRDIKIKSVIRHKYEGAGILHIEPGLYPVSSSGSLYPGLRLRYSF
ncbi:MAG: hypothetical protein WCR72_16325 [Bacteroidota bacterium]